MSSANPSNGADKAAERHKAAGQRAASLPDPVTEQLLAMVVALATEVATLRERIDSHERVSEKHKCLSTEIVEQYRATSEVQLARRKWRQDFLARVFRSVTAERERLERQEKALERQGGPGLKDQ